MSKLKVQMTELIKEEILTFGHSGIHLAFACLPCTMLGSGPAGRQGF
jgi:hypothetical protein